MEQHKHCELIKAWADGAIIQYKSSNGEWLDREEPRWTKGCEYRIKPKPMIKKYNVAYKHVGDNMARVSPFYFKSVKEFKDKYNHLQFYWVELIKASVIEVEDDD